MLSRKLLLLLNLLLGVMIWLFHLTSYSLAGRVGRAIATILPLLASLFAGYSISRLATIKVDGRLKLRTLPRTLSWLLACLPSFVQGGLRILLIVIIILFPPFWLGLMFAVGEQAGLTLIQNLDSPDGTKTARVYFAPVGPYSGGNGRVSVYVRDRNFPFIEQNVYYMSASYYANENTTDYVSWVDNHSIYVAENDVTIVLEGAKSLITAGGIFAGALMVIWLLDTDWLESLWLRFHERLIIALSQR